MSKRSNRLYRYTSLASVLDTLLNKRLVLTNPTRWPDQNDTEYLRIFKDRTGAAAVLALCMTSSPETSHHWTSFAPGTDGARLELDRQVLERAAEGSSVLCQDVKYPLMQDHVLGGEDVDQLPFFKRYPYRGEEEVRLLFTDMEIEREGYSMTIPIECVKQVTLGPNLPAPLLPAVQHVIQRLPGCGNLGVGQTTLLRNQKWIRAAQDMGPIS